MRKAGALTGAPAALLALLAVGPAWAHHALWAEFDATPPVRPCGKIAGMARLSPHAWTHVAVARGFGAGQSWMVEAARRGR